MRKLVAPDGERIIAEAVRSAEASTAAQIVVVLEASLGLGELISRQPPRERALEVFSRERVWDTKANNGILLYLLVADRDAEIIVDRGFNDLVAPTEWAAIADALSDDVARLGFPAAIAVAIERIGAITSRVFPISAAPGVSHNELDNAVRIRP